MDQFATIIADNKVLQATAIIVAVATVIAFIYKNLKPAAKFVFDAILLGRKRAFRKLNRKVARRATIDSRDSRLLITGLYRLSFIVVLRWLTGLLIIAPVVIILSIVIIKQDNFAQNIDLSFFIGFIIGLPFSAAFTWYLFKPVNELIYYLYWSRRFIIKSLRRATAISQQIND